MGRMQVGRFENRAAALDFLVEKYSIKKFPATYAVVEQGPVSTASLRFLKKFPDDLEGEVRIVGHGTNLSAAIADLFKQLKEDIEAPAEGAST
jgi:hypothetical protein